MIQAGLSRECPASPFFELIVRESAGLRKRKSQMKIRIRKRIKSRSKSKSRNRR
jgi:hypothetical protein